MENNKQALLELHRAQEESARQRWDVLMQQLEEQRQRCFQLYEAEQERLRLAAQLLEEQRQRQLAEAAVCRQQN